MSRTVLDHVRPGAENSDLYTRATERSDAQRSLRSHAQKISQDQKEGGLRNAGPLRAKSFTKGPASR